MNLTLKQLFKFGAVCASACALSATATDYVSDSFETVATNTAIGEYKLGVGGQNVTNWFSTGASTIEVNDPNYGAYTGGYPIDALDKDQILNLDTAGTTLSRAVTNVVDISLANVYVDTLVQFVLSDGAPSVDTTIGTTDVKIALYVNAQSNLVVVHNSIDSNYEYQPTNSVVNNIGPIVPGDWYRLSMELSNIGEYATRLYLDGTELTSAESVADDDTYTAGTGSYFLNLSDSQNFDAISFEGTGLLDELVVSSTAPDFGTSVVWLTLSSPDGKVTFSPVSPVESGTEVTMTAADWYEINAVTGPFTAAPTLTLPAGEVTAVLSATADCTVTAAATLVSGTDATWADAYGVSEAEFAAGTYENNYLLNISTGAVAEIVITSIAVDGIETTITVGSDGDVVDFADIYGDLTVEDSSDLVTWGIFGGYGVSSATAESTVVVTNGLQFLKAKVVPKP